MKLKYMRVHIISWYLQSLNQQMKMVEMPGYEHSIHQDHYKRDSPKKRRKNKITKYKTKLITVPKMAAQTWEK